MRDNRDPSIPRSIREELGNPVFIDRLQSSPRSDVCLMEFNGVPAIVKRVTGGPDAAERYRREVTALRLAGRMTPSPVAAMLATDPAARMLVLEYLAGTRQPAQSWSVAYATALARLHCAPVTGENHEIPNYRGPGSDDVEAFVRLAGRLEVPIPLSTHVELRAVLARLEGGGARALLHGDPCPDNAVMTGDGIRFVDLEGAQQGPAMVELAYLRIGFPTCWCVTALPPAHVAAAESAYHDTCRSMRHTGTIGDLTDACISWLIQGDALVERARRRSTDHLTRLTRHDWAWGTATARERLLHRLGVVTAMARHSDDLAGIATLTHDMQSAIKRRWPRLSAVPTTPNSPLTRP
jgi:hypothetical protein